MTRAEVLRRSVKMMNSIAVGVKHGKQAIEEGLLEKAWVYHACPAESVTNIIENGFNRSYAGVNATKFGIGCYFARDATYSARSTYSPEDKNGHKRIFMCRLALGAHCSVPFGTSCKEPPMRDTGSGSMMKMMGNVMAPKGSLRFDCTTNDQYRDGVPEIMVAYKDNQAYAEYLVTFTMGF